MYDRLFHHQPASRTDTDKEKEFNEVAKTRTQGARFSFYRKGLKNGDVICFAEDKSITAKVVSEREVEYQGQIYKLSPLAYRLYDERGKVNSSGAYQGSFYFLFNGTRLKDMPDL